MAIFDKTMGAIEGLASRTGREWKYVSRVSGDVNFATYIAQRPRLRAGMKFTGAYGAAGAAGGFALSDGSVSDRMRGAAIGGFAGAVLAGGWSAYTMTGKAGENFLSRQRGITGKSVLESSLVSRESVFGKGEDGIRGISKLPTKNKAKTLGAMAASPAFWF